MSKKIGFVGLGTMGFPMADTVKEVAELADEAIISMVRDYSQNLDVIFADKGILTAQNTDGKTIIVMSTLSPDAMNQLAARVESESGLKLISAAVSGGRTGAEAGTLSIITSGHEEIVRSFAPYFDAMGSNTFYYGPAAGNSQVAKLVNNMILAVNMNAVAEGLKLGKHYGLPEEEIIKLLQVSTGDSWVARNWPEVSQWTADIALAVLQKDLIATYEESIKHNLEMPFNALSSIQLFHSKSSVFPYLKVTILCENDYI
jgi:3-hydroxyisobutyrate dehydrogenase-like beta-hydroxyacid dehydrogenase